MVLMNLRCGAFFLLFVCASGDMYSVVVEGVEIERDCHGVKREREFIVGVVVG